MVSCLTGKYFTILSIVSIPFRYCPLNGLFSRDGTLFETNLSFQTCPGLFKRLKNSRNNNEEMSNIHYAAHLNGHIEACNVLLDIGLYGTVVFSSPVFLCHTPPLLLYLLVCEATNKFGHGGWNDFIFSSKSETFSWQHLYIPCDLFLFLTSEKGCFTGFSNNKNQ